MQYLHSFPLQIYFQLPSFVEDGERNEKHYQESRNIVLHKYGVSVLNIWQLQAGTDQTERHKPIRRWKTNSCAAANFKIETLQGPAKTINRSELTPHFFFFVFFLSFKQYYTLDALSFVPLKYNMYSPTICHLCLAQLITSLSTLLLKVIREWSVIWIRAYWTIDYFYLAQLRAVPSFQSHDRF